MANSFDAELDALWDFDDPAKSERSFRARLAEERCLCLEHAAQIRTQIARSLGLQRRFDEANALLDEVERALPPGESLSRVRLLLERGRVLNSAGDPAAALPRFLEAWEMAFPLGLDFYAIDAAHMLAIVESRSAALEWNERAFDLAHRSTDERARRWRGSLLNNIGWMLHAAGEHERALAAFERALDLRRAERAEQPIRIARWCVARGMRALGQIEEALREQHALLADVQASGDRDGFVHEEIAECLLALGRTAEARAHFSLAHAVLSEDPWLTEREPQRLARLARLGMEHRGGPPG